MDATDYRKLVAYLNSPPPTVIADWPNFIHPHTLPIGPDWELPPLATLTPNTFRRLSPSATLVVNMMAYEQIITELLARFSANENAGGRDELL